ncbi:MAG: HD domain-containing phosphohydrolase [Synechococcaceae cyanobacterium ELA182]
MPVVQLSGASLQSVAGSDAHTEGADAALVEVLAVATALGSASDLATLLHQILRACRHLTASDAGSVYLIEPARRSRGNPPTGLPQEQPESGQAQLWFAASQNASIGQAEGIASDLAPQLLDIRFPLSPERLVGWCALEGEVLNIANVYALPPDLPYRFDASVDRQLGYRAVSMLNVPMRSTTGEVVGVLQLINRKHRASDRLEPATAEALTRPYDRQDQRLIEAMASLAAVSVERTLLIAQQDGLIEAIVTLLASAIDAKSAYTGGHCARVPELALMLARAAEAVESGPLAEFCFRDGRQWREFRIGAYLHDCGKITTPEAVVDKATKLETQYNRIHEIRTRFEVLLRDARIAQLEGQLAGGDPVELAQVYERRRVELHEQFALVAAANLGEERMDPERINQLQQIAAQTWWRHFDDRLGLAWEEWQRRTQAGADGETNDDFDSLPQREPLLADKPWHRVPRDSAAIPDPRHGFRMAIPELLRHHGELHNLGIQAGTLTAEERYTINEHIVQTILMLEALPFPAWLEQVPYYAGTHHETLQGTGYPRALAADQLTVPARIMAIADIFEALTASDRPYKKAKSLAESIGILAGLRDRGHIDPDLFALFLSSGVYLRYAERFLRPEQIDAVAIDTVLTPPG